MGKMGATALGNLRRVPTGLIHMVSGNIGEVDSRRKSLTVWMKGHDSVVLVKLDTEELKEGEYPMLVVGSGNLGRIEEFVRNFR